MFEEINYFTKSTGNMNNQQNSYNTQLNLYNPYQGYVRGNLFKNLYQEYKNYSPIKLNINSEKMEMLVNIGQMGFAAHELNLYLDNYPNDRDALNLFNKYSKMTLELVKKYESKYGPLMVSNYLDSHIPFKWESEKWPWEV